MSHSLQVGERVFSFSSTLFPEDSYLRKIFEEPWKSSSSTKNFLDLDPTVFEIILNHFRTQTLTNTRINIFRYIDNKTKVSLWHSLNYLGLLPSVAMSVDIYQESSMTAVLVVEGIYTFKCEVAGQPRVYSSLVETAFPTACCPFSFIQLGDSIQMTIDLIHDRILWGFNDIKEEQRFSPGKKNDHGLFRIKISNIVNLQSL